MLLPLIFVLIAIGAFSLLNLLGGQNDERSQVSPALPTAGDPVVPSDALDDPANAPSIPKLRDPITNDEGLEPLVSETLARKDKVDLQHLSSDVQIGEDIHLPEDTPLGLTPALSDLGKEEQPTYGRVRVDGFGNVTLIQGRGVPGTQIDLLVNGDLVSGTQVTPGGTWSLYEPGLLSQGEYELRLRAVLTDGRVGLSDQVVLTHLDAANSSGQIPPALLHEDGQIVHILSGPQFVPRLLPQAMIFSQEGVFIYGKAPVGSWVRMAGDTSLTNEVLVGTDGLWTLRLVDPDQGFVTLIQESLDTSKQAIQVNLRLPTRGEAQGDGALSFDLGQSLAYFFEDSLSRP